MFSVNEDIMQPVLAVVHFSSGYCHILLSVLWSSLVLSKSFIIVQYCITIFLFSDIFLPITVVHMNKSFVLFDNSASGPLSPTKQE